MLYFPIPKEECFALISDTPVEGCGNVFDINDIVGVANLLISDMK